uniref:Phospholipase A2 domain-containing protein n=1 Tax=Strongyloides papillosus TaxID=174720 RepID=A0A0N5CAU3_STREA
MLYLYYFLISSLALFISPDEQTWECGSDDFSKLLSESSIDANCPELKWEVNGCCVNHDSCYDKQLGQKHCDDIFCDCVARVTIPSKKCHEDDAESFCIVVREFGEAAYNASAPSLHTEPTTTAIKTTTMPTTQKTHSKHMSFGNFSTNITNKSQFSSGSLALRPRRFS